MKSDKHGCSTCVNGKESYEHFYSEIARKNFVQYDFRTNDELFSGVFLSLELARSERDRWIENKKMNGEE